PPAWKLRGMFLSWNRVPLTKCFAKTDTPQGVRLQRVKLSRIPLTTDFTELQVEAGELLGRIDRQNSSFRTTRTIIIKFGLHVSFVELKSAKNALNGVTGRIDDKNSVFCSIRFRLEI
ncbi:hypothetical protein TNCV_2116921, partial [Trichonephila clavipes]